MPIFQLTEEIQFPPVEMATPEGILAIGGDLSPERLITAYSSGIFPWYTEESPILWWSPNPRFVLFLNELKLSKSTRKVIKKNPFSFTFDKCFEEVIKSCSLPRKSEFGTWIVKDMIEAYIRLHNMGYAHSVEAWQDGKLAGGLYGVSLGRCFFGESMFTKVSNASKLSLVFLVNTLRKLEFHFIDSQVYTPHLARMGAREIPRSEYIKLLKGALKFDTLKGNWGTILNEDLLKKSLEESFSI